jgi:hypothetical protein
MDHLNAVHGKGEIWASIVAHSINVWGDEVVTYRLHYPRFIHAEFMTHRMFSRNASSSRAIPVKTVLDQVERKPAMPIHWGKNQAGMQADGELNSDVIIPGHLVDWKNQIMLAATMSREGAWEEAAGEAAHIAKAMMDAGYHKQVVNRLLEPFQFMNVVMSATDMENFFYLRDHTDADPNIAELARVMREAKLHSMPQVLRYGEWHTPYVRNMRTGDGTLRYFDGDTELTAEQAQKVSASCAAQASYRKLDSTIEKAISIYDRLVVSEPIHASPFEHVATPFDEHEVMVRNRAKALLRDEGIDGFDQVMYKGNFKGWTQLRKMFPNENRV